jgi:hypothetical protein
MTRPSEGRVNRHTGRGTWVRWWWRIPSHRADPCWWRTARSVEDRSEHRRARAQGARGCARWLDVFEPTHPERLEDPLMQRERPVSLLIDEVEALWDPIAERDDWAPLEAKIAEIRAAVS